MYWFVYFLSKFPIALIFPFLKKEDPTVWFDWQFHAFAVIGKEGNVFNELVLVDHRATSESIKTSVFDDSIIENRRFKCTVSAKIVIWPHL